LAAKGNAEAEYNFGVSYEDGQGIGRDYGQAVRWYRQAAEHEHQMAQDNLGVMYAKGRGLPKDDVTANMWFIIAAAGGNRTATQNREITEKTMTAAQILAAQKLARQWMRDFRI